MTNPASRATTLTRNIAWIGAAGTAAIIAVNAAGHTTPELSDASLAILATSATIQTCIAAFAGRVTTHANELLAALICLLTAATTASLAATPGETGAQTYIYFILLITVNGAAQTSTRLWTATTVWVVAAWVTTTVLIASNELTPVVTVTPLILAGTVSAYLHHTNKTHLAALEQQTQVAIKAAHTDPLTGLYNRRGLTEQTRGALEAAAEHHTNVTATFIDVNGLKHINDTYGHDAGDAAITAVANAITATTRPGDHAARWGGDEFVIITSGHIPDIDTLTHRLNTWLHTNTNPPHPSVSVGQTRTTTTKESTPTDILLDLITGADENMYDRRHNPAQ